MRGGDHHAEGGLILLHKEGDRRGGDYPNVEHLDPGRGHPGGQRRADHLTRSPRIPPDDRPAPLVT